MRPLTTTRRIRDVANILEVCAELAVDTPQFERRLKQFNSLMQRYSGPRADLVPFSEQAVQALKAYLRNYAANGGPSSLIITGGER